jgi:metal-responsive CopG/Arc/MetJ family transcriptional regulator
MATIKTAISIDKNLFDTVNELAAEIKLSRSQIFSQAVQYFIDKRDDLDLIRRINRAYSDVLDADETKLLEKSKKKYKEIVKEKWQ